MCISFVLCICLVFLFHGKEYISFSYCAGRMVVCLCSLSLSLSLSLVQSSALPLSHVLERGCGVSSALCSLFGPVRSLLSWMTSSREPRFTGPGAQSIAAQTAAGRFPGGGAGAARGKTRSQTTNRMSPSPNCMDIVISRLVPYLVS